VLKVDAAPEDWSAGEGDALITNVPGLALCAQTADCTPVLLYDAENAAIAAIHAGWRGVIAEVIPAAINALNQAYGSRAEALQAVIGPAVAPENYRVGPEVLEQFEALFGSLDDGLALPRDSEGGAGLNVSEGARRQLLRAGVSEDAIHWLKACTFAGRRPVLLVPSRRAGRPCRSFRRPVRRHHAGGLGQELDHGVGDHRLFIRRDHPDIDTAVRCADPGGVAMGRLIGALVDGETKILKA
jgi:YfiH family protein